MIVEEKTLSSEMLYKGAILNLRKDKVTVRDGRESYREIVEHNGGVIILGVTEDGRIPMIKQYRKALEKVAFELPAGKLELGEDPLEAAGREFREETGYTAAEIKHIISYYPTVGYSTEFLHIYFATGLTAGETDFDDNEAIEIAEYTPAELYEMIDNGTMDDGKSLIALLLYRNSTAF